MILNVQHSLFYDWLCYLLPLGPGVAKQAAEEEEDDSSGYWMNEWMRMVFLEQPPTLPGAHKKLRDIFLQYILDNMKGQNKIIAHYSSPKICR